MKNYILFAYQEFSPAGGVKDIVGDFDSIEDAVAFYNEVKDKRDWTVFNVFNRETGEIYPEG